MRYWQLVEYLEKSNIDLCYRQGDMEAYNDVVFNINGRQVVIECCTNEFYIYARDNINLIEESHDLANFSTAKEVMKFLKINN